MRRQDRRDQIKFKGFKPGNVPYYTTNLHDVVIVNDHALQVKRWANGRPVEFYPVTRWRMFLIGLRATFKKMWMVWR